MSIQSAFTSFLFNDFNQSVESNDNPCTTLYVELFEDDTYRMLWSHQIGNRYSSPGLLVSIPKLDEDDVFHQMAEKEINDTFEFNLSLQGDNYGCLLVA